MLYLHLLSVILCKNVIRDPMQTPLSYSTKIIDKLGVYVCDHNNTKRSPVYLSNIFHGNVIVSQCTFIMCKSKENNGNVLNCQGEADIIIESCKFINCGENSYQSIVKLYSKYEHSIKFTNCTFHFDNDIFSCYVFDTKSSVNLIFDHCAFIKCPITIINHEISSFQFTSNTVNSANKKIISINYLAFNLNISSNIFKNNVLIGSSFIKLIHKLNEINLYNNTFSNISSDSYNKLFSIYNGDDLKSNLFINDCKFIDNKNTQIGSLFSSRNLALVFKNCEFIGNNCTNRNGGALSINIIDHLSINHCFFKNNKAFQHGGAITIYMASKIKIISCSFMENIANNDYHSSVLEKEEGKGGAIYIDLQFFYMENDYAKIEKCNFTSNSAFYGYAIYIKRYDDSKIFNINQNIFKNNYNKNTNASNKGIIVSEMLCLDINLILNLNKFLPNDKNSMEYSILNVDQIDKSHIPNKAKCKSKCKKNIYSKLILISPPIIFILIIITFTIFHAMHNEQCNTIFLIILGESSLSISESFNENKVKKYGNYCFTSIAVLIKRLIKKHLGIKERNIGIFGKGTKANYDITSVLPNNKILVQLTIDEIYEAKISQSELDFISFQNVDDLIISIYSFIDNTKCTMPNIILFLYDHGDEKHFTDLKFLELYLGLLNIPHSSLHIYNESCYSNSMILMIKNYFTISEIISSFTPKITQKELLFLASVGKEILPEGDCNQWDKILALEKKYYEYIGKNNSKITFKYMISSVIENNNLDKLYEKLSSDFSKTDVDVLIKFVECYLSYFNIPDYYKDIHLIFLKKTNVIKEALIKCNCNNSKFFKIINDLYKNAPNFADNQYKMHKNHSIVTTSYEKDTLPTFGTIRINKKQKIIAGSPAMGAYIIEALMNRSLSKNSIDNIKKMVYGNTKGYIREYAAQSLKIRKKKWVRLNINYWESQVISKEKIFLNQDRNSMKIGEIMNSIGFKLISSCNIKFNENNYCITKKMQPLYISSHNLNVIGVRLADLNQDHDFSSETISDDSYYSELNKENSENNDDNSENSDDNSDDNNNSEHNNNLSNSLSITNSNNIKQTFSLEILLRDFDYDMPIPHMYVVKISYYAIKEYMVYPLRVCEILKYELSKLEENQKFIQKYSCTNKDSPNEIPYEIRSMVCNWMYHFFPTYIFQEALNSFIMSFYQFMVKYNIPKNNAKDIFYRCTNIADQVASQTSLVDMKPAYYPNRLKKRFLI